MSKIKLEIRNRRTGLTLFEYEEESNRLKDTLEKAIEEKADLRGADLSESDLRGADLRRANLRETYLRGADLRRANLSIANLSGANLRGADLRGTYIYLSDDEIEEENIIRDFEKKNDIKITETYINRNIFPTKWDCFWKYGLTICNWKVKEK